MTFRRVPPVYSPISAGALWRGLATALSPGAAAQARRELDDWVRGTYQSDAWLWTDSGTSALLLALRLAGSAGHRRVALPAYGCYDLATACDGAAVEVALYDLDPTTLGPDWESLESALKAGADMVVVAHLYGIPVDLERARELASRFGAVLIEDAAQGVGASSGGRPLGAHGEMGILSFGRGKGLTAGGGGLLLARGRWAERLSALPPLPKAGRGFGRLFKSVVQWAFTDPSVYWIPAALPFLGLGETVYRSWSPPTALGAAGFGILGEQLQEIEPEAQVRRRIARKLLEAIEAVPDTRLHAPILSAKAVPGFLRVPILAIGGSRALLLSKHSRRLGVSPGYPGQLAALQGFGGRVRGAQARFAGAERLVNELLTLPAHSRLAPQDLARIQMHLSRDNGDTEPRSGQEAS